MIINTVLIMHQSEYLLLILCLASFITIPAFAQEDCDTWFRFIYDKENDCAPCTNGMEKLLAPFGH